MNDEFELRLIVQARRDGIARHVVGAVIRRDGAVLLLARSSDDFMGGMYEFPSGQVDDGERLERALRREVAEETGLTVDRIERYLGSFDYTSQSGSPTRQFNFLVSVAASTNIILTEHDGYVWCSPEAVERHPTSTSVEQVLARLFRTA
jgi:8-oxo-dGTP diphosphatase